MHIASKPDVFKIFPGLLGKAMKPDPAQRHLHRVEAGWERTGSVLGVYWECIWSTLCVLSRGHARLFWHHEFWSLGYSPEVTIPVNGDHQFHILRNEDRSQARPLWRGL